MSCKLPKRSKLDAYEQAIEDSLEKGKRVKNYKELKEQLNLATKGYVKKEKVAFNSFRPVNLTQNHKL